MAGKKMIVPFEENKFYYNGIRGILSSIVYSMLGVYATALMTGEVSIKEFFEFPLMTVNVWVAICMILWRKSHTTPNKVVLSIEPLWFYPKIAHVFLVLLYVMIGVFCSLMFEAFVKITTSYANLIALYISMALFLILIFCFSSLSISTFAEENSSTVDSDEQTT